MMRVKIDYQEGTATAVPSLMLDLANQAGLQLL